MLFSTKVMLFTTLHSWMKADHYFARIRRSPNVHVYASRTEALMLSEMAANGGHCDGRRFHAKTHRDGLSQWHPR